MSGRKNVIEPVLLASATSLGASFNSNPTTVQFMDRVSIEINVTGSAGSAVGTFVIQARVSPSAQSPLGNSSGPSTAWQTLPLSGSMTTSSANETLTADIITTGLVQLRVAYTRTSGTGTVDIWIAAKES